MKHCILNVTTHEYDEILQLNHDSLTWSYEDKVLLRGLEALLGRDVVEQIRQYDECRMQKHDSLDGIPRIQEDAAVHSVQEQLLLLPVSGNCRGEAAGCPTGLAASNDLALSEK